MEDPKMEKRSGWAPGSALDFHKPNCEQMEGIGEGVPRLGWVEGEDLRSGDLLRPGKSSTPASAASSRENGDYQGSQELDSEGDTSRKSRGEGWGVGGGGLQGAKEKGAPARARAHPEPAPPTSPGLGEEIGPRADKRRVLPPNWVAGEDPGATEQEAEEQPEQVGLH